MAVLDPLLVELVFPQDSSLPLPQVFEVPDFPFDPSRGSHRLTLSEAAEIFIDRADFRLVDSEDYFGLAPNKTVALKYAFTIRCDHVEEDAEGRPVKLRCSVVAEGKEEKPKGAIHWVDKASAVRAEVRVYEPLFTVEEPSDEHWEAELNANSEVVHPNALLDPHVLAHPHLSPGTCFQFERVGFFAVDKDSSSPSGLVFNLTVTLKDSKPKAAGGANRSRKEEQARQLAEKTARMNTPPEQLFRLQTDLYSAFDEDGVPTHDSKGEKLSKSAYKNLKKEWEKQKKLYEKSKN